MDKVEYNKKINDLLSDADTYKLITRDPTPSTEVELNRLLRKFVKEKKITDAQYQHLHASGGQTPRFYGLPKVHKPGNPLRPIVAFVNSPTYNVSRYVSDILSPIALENTHRAKNGAEVAETVRDITLGEDDEMVSFDVVALFTSIPVDLACSITLDRLHQDTDLQDRTALTPDDIIVLLRFCLETTYFSYGGQLYKQVFGTAMGSPVSATVADIVMRHIEETSLGVFPFDVVLWKRYVDDILSFLKRQHVRMLLDILNAFHPRIQFTTESESDHRLPFLDLQLTRQSDGSITTSVYRKPTHTDAYLRFESEHPPSHKASVVKTLMGRIPSHVTDSLEQSHEEHHVMEALHLCGYSNNFIKKNRPSSLTTTSEDRDKPKFRAPIPYVRGLSEQVSRILRRHDIGTVYVPGTSLRDLLVHPKDVVPIVSQASVVYSVPCKDCGKSYIGETQRRLGDRLKEHKRAVRNAEVTTSALAEHVWDNDHNIDWENAKILDRARHWRERKYRESLAISYEVNNINRDKGLELPEQFINIIKSAR